jgi:PAS domain S-box-containing protein
VVVYTTTSVPGFLEEERDLIDQLWRMLIESIERREALAKIQESEAKFRGFYDAGLVGLAVTSMEKGWLMVNDRLCELFGYARQDLIQMTWTELTHPEDLDADLAHFQKLLDGKCDAYEMNKRFFHKDGSIIHAKIAVKVVRKLDGSPDYFLAMVEDTTKRSQAEEKLARKHEEMLSVFESSELTIYVVDPSDDSLVFSNRRDLLVEADAETHRTCYRAIYHRDERCDFCTNAQLLSGAGPLKWEQVDASGSTIQFVDQLIDWPDGRKLRLTFASDVSDLARARRHLRHQEARYHSIFDEAPVSIWEEDWSEVYEQLRRVIGQKGDESYAEFFEKRPEFVSQLLKAVNIINVNDETLRMFEADDKEQMLNSLETVFATEDTVPGFVRELVALCEGKAVHRTEMRLRTVKGDLREVMLTMTFPPLKSHGNFVIVSLMDITERVLNERRLKEVSSELGRSNARMKAVMDSMDALIYVADMETYEILFINDYAHKIFGDLVGKTCWQTLQCGLDGPCDFCTNHLLLRDGEPSGVHRWEFQNTVNRHWYDCRDQAIPWTDGRYVRMEIATDITDRKRTEQALSQTLEQLKRSNEELEQFAYVASHDLQEPLRMITSFTQLFARKYEDLLDEKARSYVDFIVDGGERMQGLLNDLLMFSRVDRKGERFETCNVGSAAENALKNLSHRIEEMDAQVSVEKLPILTADKTQLMQLFQNLIGNALKFHGENRTIIKVSCEELESEWKFAIADNGIGIEPAYQKRIFEVFQRLHGRDKYEGTGIGLAICKKIVGRHGGSIWVVSEPGQGSTFFFTLPKCNQDEH